MKWAIGLSIVASVLFVILGLSHIIDINRFAYLILHPGLSTSTDILNGIMSGVPALFLVAGIFEIAVEVIKHNSRSKSKS
jgi:type III secretory pathway component EscU